MFNVETAMRYYSSASYLNQYNRFYTLMTQPPEPVSLMIILKEVPGHIVALRDAFSTDEID